MLTLAGAKASTRIRGTSATRPGAGRGTAVELGLDRLDLVLLRPELQGPAPLIPRLDRTPILPIGVAKMIVDRRVFRHELDRLLEILDRAGIVAQSVMRPPQAIDDIAVFGAQLDRLLDHLEAALQILAAVDPGVAQIIQDQWLVGLELEGTSEIVLRPFPLAGTFERNSPAVEQRPALGQACCLKALDRLVIGVDRFGKALLAAQQIAELHVGTGS